MKKLIQTAASLAKVALRSRPSREAWSVGRGGRLIVMGNGPSLSETITRYGDLLASSDTTAVNFAANTDEFFRLKPRHYVLADPHFFASPAHPNVAALWSNIAGTFWPMTLHIPVGMRLPRELEDHASVSVRRFNLTPAEGFDGVCHALFSRGLAMPRPRNVLIPALMEGIRDGYAEIYIVGADHTWPHTLYVDDSNRVVTVQPHFYKEDPRELDRIAEAYRGVRLHDVLGSMAVAFRSYHAVRAYAEKRGVRIYNATPGSLIDAFERKLPEKE